MIKARSLALLICLAALAVCTEAYRKGDGTAYSGKGEKDKTGFNSCQFGKLDAQWEKMYAALPSQAFDRGSDCGRCIRARGTEDDAPGDWVTVMIVDECASCKGSGDVDFSKDALKAITGYSWDRKGVEWEFTSCKDEREEEEEEEEEGETKEEEQEEQEEQEESKKDRKGRKDRRLLSHTRV